ncbi:MAG: carboxypeptidase regulatory-like domain-containing protein [Deltaproteobacteria bacterium]|nr:carboxypeptidase regulatory-like domain-containing protein [Deltaproteobacteria bacterium]
MRLFTRLQKVNRSAAAGLIFLIVIGVSALKFGCARDFSKPEPLPGPGAITGELEEGITLPQPVGDARIRLLECGLSVQSAGDGKFIVDDVPTGDYTVRIDVTLDVDGDETIYSVEEGPALVRGPAVYPMGRLRLTPAGTARGTLTVSDGSTTLNAVVYVVDGDQLTFVGDGGNYNLTGIPAGTRQISAAKPGFMVVAPETIEVTPGGIISVPDLQLSPNPAGAVGSVSGTVLLGNPGPEAGVSVALIERFSSLRYATRTDQNGEWRLADIPIGFYELRVVHEGYRSVGLPNLEIRDKQETSLPTLILPPDSSNTPQNPADGDPNGNIDDDSDGIPDITDNCPVVPNPDQTDSNSDGIGDACSVGDNPSDHDGDGVPNYFDNCPELFNPAQENHDDDPLGDECDQDDDNDGLLDGSDMCPYIPDPGNDPGLCDWALIYAGQDEVGDIHLYHYRITPEGGETIQLTQGHEQAWGVSVAKILGINWVYFHRRTSDEQPFAICRFELATAFEQPIEDPECFSGGAWGNSDLMNPTICDSIPPFLFYESFEQDRYAIYIAEILPPPQAPQVRGLLDLAPLHQVFFTRPYSFRYPHCSIVLGANLPVLGYSFDFADRSAGQLDWNSAVAGFEPDTLLVFQNAPVGFSAYSHERRLSPGHHVDYDGWFFDRESGLRSDIYFEPTEIPSPTEVIVNGARNMSPAFLFGPDGASGLLAYQSDLYGSFDIYVTSLGSGGVVRVTSGAGWEGSPVWIQKF